MKIVFTREDYNKYKNKDIERTIIMNIDIVIQNPRAFDNEEDDYRNVLQFTAYGSKDDTIYVAFETEEIATQCFVTLLKTNILDLREYECDIIRADEEGLEILTTDDFRDSIS